MSAEARTLTSRLPTKTVASVDAGAPPAEATMEAKLARKGSASNEGTASSALTPVSRVTMSWVATNPTSACWIPMLSGSCAGVKTMDETAAAFRNCTRPLYVPATSDPVLEGRFDGGGSAASSAGFGARSSAGAPGRRAPMSRDAGRSAPAGSAAARSSGASSRDGARRGNPTATWKNSKRGRQRMPRALRAGMQTCRRELTIAIDEIQIP